MSHEGIRFVSQEEADRKKEEEKQLPREATDPIKVRVHKTEGTGVEIDWRDWHHSSWSFTWLRNACPCATCHEERENLGLKIGESKPKSAQLLPLYQAPIKPDEVTPVGRYALKFVWNDGHQGGIYSWNYLRANCQCDECKAKA